MSWKLTALFLSLPRAAFSGAALLAGASLLVGGCGGGGSGSGGGGQSTTGGDTGVASGCVSAAECPGMDTECQSRTCDAGVCGIKNTPAGTPSANQVPGDCKVVACDGNGMSASNDDDADVLDDQNECTEDTCAKGMPLNTALPPGAACATGGTVCDGKGACVECIDGAMCTSGVCTDDKCVDPTCTDAVKNGSETDVDCGGPDCAPCADGQVCGVASDCASLVCTDMICQAPTCLDAVKNGLETDVDCGGPDCSPCGPAQGCIQDADCVGAQCSGSQCVANCTDQTKNNNETDVDCGGPDCAGCAPGQACMNAGDCESEVCKANVCEAPACGDQVVNGAETCDDGNADANDGCGATCLVEAGYLCMGEPSVCVPVCGDGFVIGGEICDDGNFVDGDGCSTMCTVETGFACLGTPSLCKAICGDGQVYGEETCDDANAISNDGCSSACVVEAGFSCVGQPSICTTICGDGLVKGAEGCDDGNLTNGDGCTSSCTVQPNYFCSGQPSMCVMVVCGDSVVGPGETCDDGNTKSCDGCSSKCQTEAQAGPNLALTIPDDGYNGTIGSMACVNIPVSSAGDGLIDSMCVQLGVSHTWIGDLAIKVVSPANTVVTLMSRPGAAEATDDGTDVVFGDSTNLDKAYPVVFVDAGPKSAESMGNTIVDTQIVCKDDLACTYDPAAGAAAPGKLAAFVNQLGAGTWKVCVGDSAQQDTGTIEFVRLGISQ